MADINKNYIIYKNRHSTLGKIFLIIGIAHFAISMIIIGFTVPLRETLRDIAVGNYDIVIDNLGVAFPLAFGLIFTILGIWKYSKGRKEKKLRAQLAEKLHNSGRQTNATVTYVMPDLRYRVNGMPVFSIMVYQFQDEMGRTYQRKMEDMRTELVILHGIAIGSQIPIKYLPEDPTQNMVYLLVPNTNQIP